MHQLFSTFEFFNLYFFITAMQIQGMQQQQIVTSDRPIMPVASMPTQQAQQVQQLQQSLPGTVTQTGIPLQPNLAVTQQPMPMNVQQIHSVRK